MRAQKVSMLLPSKQLILSVILFTGLLFPQQDLRQGISWYEKREWQKAIEFFINSLKQNPDSKLSYHYLGASYLESGKFKEAYEVLKSGAVKYPSEKSIIGNYINAGLMTGKVDEPIKAGERYIKQNPADAATKALIAAAYSKQGEQLLVKGKYSDALSAARTALKYSNNEENAHTVIIRGYILSGKTKEALSESENSVKLFPGSVSVQTAHLAALNSSQEYEKALALAQKLNSRFREDIDFQMQLAFLYRANYKIQEGADVFERLINKNPVREQVYDGAISYFESLNQFDKVRTLYEAKIKNFGRENEFRIKIAESYENEKLPHMARNVYLGILERDNLKEIRLLLAYSYLDNSLRDSAVLQLENVLRNDNSDYEANRLLCEAHLETKSDKQFMEAAESFYSHHRDDFRANYYLSLAYFGLGDSALTRRFAEAARKLKPQSPFPYSVLAVSAKTGGDISSARYYSRQAVVKALAEIKEMESAINKLLSESNAENPRENLRKASTLKKELAELNNVLDKNFANLKQLCNTEELRAVLNSLLISYPNNPFVQKEKGDYHKERNEPDSAVYFYIRALKTNPSLSACHSSLAGIYAKKGDFTEAIKSVKRAISAEPLNNSLYDDLIKYASQNGTINELADDWIRIYKTDRSNMVLRERLIEVLHKTDRFQEANEIVRDINE